MKRIFAIGDIHGCYDQLKALVEKIPIDFFHDTLLFIGDYIDRGNDSKGVIDILIKLMESSSNVQCLMGNHVSLFLESSVVV